MSSSSSSSSSPPPPPPPPKTTTIQQPPRNDEKNDIVFGRFVIPPSSVFYQSKKKNDNNNDSATSYAFVNLRPIVPGHVLVIPEERVATMAELSMEAYIDMWTTVRAVQDVLRRHYADATAFNVAVQDGRAAGQSVPHVHVHILPRTGGDYQRNDDVYTDLETWAPRPAAQIANGINENLVDDGSNNKKGTLHVPADKERRDRTIQEMTEEATLYRKILEEFM